MLTTSPLAGSARAFAGPADRSTRFQHYASGLLARVVPLAFGAVVSAALVLGWQARDEQILTPSEGLGYWLGIVGSLLMLTLLVYPLRKRFKRLRALGGVKGWFRAHMLFGILGPTLILFHANFHLESLNASVATAAMLIVVASGIVGRYLHARVHMGLYGRRAEAEDILADIAALRSALSGDLQDDPVVTREIAALEHTLPKPDDGVLRSACALLYAGSRTRRAERGLYRRAKSVVKAEAQRRGWSRMERAARLEVVRTHLRLFRRAVLKAATYAIYARALALWHTLHMPLFVLLIATVILHIVAVHRY